MKIFKDQKDVNVLFLILIVYIPLSAHLIRGLGIPGINVFTLLEIAVYIVALKKFKSDYQSPLKNRIRLYYFMLSYSLLLAVLNGSAHLFDDIVIFKTAISYSLLYFIYGNYFDHEKQIKLFEYAFVFVTFIVALEILRETLDFGIGSGKRAAGPFGDDEAASNYAGLFMSWTSAFVFSLTLYAKSFFIRTIYFSVFAMGLLSVFYTYSRASLGALALSCFFISIFRHKSLSIFIVLMVANFSLWAPETVTKRLESTVETSSDTGEEQLEHSAKSRFEIWDRAYILMAESPQGVGFNQFKDRIDPLMPADITARDAHNHFILITTEGSIISGIVLLFMLAGFFFTSLSLSRGHDMRAYGLGIAGATIVIVMVNAYNSLIYSGEVMGLYWIYAAITFKYYHILNNKQQSGIVEPPVSDKIATKDSGKVPLIERDTWV